MRCRLWSKARTAGTGPEVSNWMEAASLAVWDEDSRMGPAAIPASSDAF